LAQLRRAAPIVGVILAGGLSRRLGGGDKCLLPLGGRPLLAHAIERLTPQVDALVLNANGDPSRFAPFGLPVIGDTIPGYAGPLAGILAGMLWARANFPDARLIATAAADTPFFPSDLVARLTAAAGDADIAIPRTAGRVHPVFGVFPVASADNLDRFIRTAGSRKVTVWLDREHVEVVDFDDRMSGGFDPFFNINAPDDLRAAEAAVTASQLRGR
jgi:molybdopterin-guanine dinucleotide biosynthesis protein A